MFQRHISEGLRGSGEMTMKKVFAVFVSVLAVAAAGALYVRSSDPEKLHARAAASLAPEGNFVDLADGSTWYSLDGPADGPLVVLVHGYAVSSIIWEHNWKALADAGFRVLRYDQFGRGWSAHPRGVYSLHALASQLDTLLQHVTPGSRPVLVCVSAGCPLAATYALEHPAVLRGIVLVDPQANAFNPPARSGIPLLQDWQRQRDLAQLAESIHTSYVAIAATHDVQRRIKGYGAALDEIAQEQSTDPHSLYRALGALPIPLALAEGAQDRGQARRKALMQAIPRLEYREIEDAPHGANFHAPARANAILVELLQQQLPAPAATP